MLNFLSLEFASFLYNIEKGGEGLALNINQIWNRIRDMLQLALDSVNCLNYFCRPLSGVYLCELWRLLLYIYPSSSKFIFTKATKCVVQIDLLLEKKWQAFFFLTKMSIQRRTLTNPLINWSIFRLQGDVYRHFFTLKASTECFPHLYLTQSSL